jgi:hypothetical protein
MEDFRESVLWEYAKEEFGNLTLDEKIRRCADIIYPDKNNTDLNIEEKIKVILQLPDPISFISYYADEKEKQVIDYLAMGYTYREVCLETGLKSRSSIREIVKRFGQRIQGEL